MGPLARVTPADQVTDPREILGRSLQAVIDASSVHVETTVGGRIPGSLVGVPGAWAALDGTQASLDLRPQDARTRLAFRSPALGLEVESVTLWDTLAFRQAGGPWTRASLAAVVGDSGIDANPLTLVDRLRAWLASPGAPVPTSTDVVCAAPSGRCRQVQLVVGPEAGDLLLRLRPGGARPGTGPDPGPTITRIVLQSDASTLQPTRLEVEVRDAGGSVALAATADFTGWNEPGVIPDPPGS